MTLVPRWFQALNSRFKSPKSGLYADRRWYHPVALARRVINYYLFICMALFFLQNWLLFPRAATGAVLPKEDAISAAGGVGLVPWDYPTTPATSPQGYVPRDFAKAAPRGTIVVFHGNGGWAFSRTYYVDAFAGRGFRTFLYEYPGYGGRPGSPSSGSIIGDGRALIRSLDQAGYGPVYVWGESVGSGLAAEICNDPTLPVHGLTLLTPWDSLSNAASVYYPFVPVSLLLWDKYDSIANLQKFPHPICVVCSQNDEVLPVRLGLNLYDHLPGPKKLIVQPDCGHNDWPMGPDLPWWNEALNFIAPTQ